MPNITFSSQNLDHFSFEDAFNAARTEIGSPNGIFYWGGKPFNTRTDAELASMDSDEKEAYSNAVISALEGHNPTNSGIPEPAVAESAPEPEVPEISDAELETGVEAESAGSWISSILESIFGE